MHFQNLAGTCLLALATTSVAEYLPYDHILWGNRAEKRQATSSSAAATATRVADSACKNGPFSRNCWSAGYSVATDFDAKWPTTGNTVSYTLELQNSTCSPDGGPSRPCQLFNGQFPGPTITANWGDMIQVTVKNSLTTNGTGIHWHGIRQLGTTQEDGVPGITECPLAPGYQKTYTFRATQFGQTWYHSHWSSQYGDGAFGSLVINGPASANYDYDLGPMPLTDWYYPTAFQIGLISHSNLQKGSPPPPADNILINGTNKNANGGGSYNKVTGLVAGKKYRLRLINTSVDNMMYVSLDNHDFTVISGDLVPIQPYTTKWITIAVGQRYDVIFKADQPAGNYWFRAEVAGPCRSQNNFYGRSVFSYKGVADADPTSSASSMPTVCKDEGPLVPWVKNNVSATDFLSQVTNLDVDLTVEQVTTNGQNIVFWGINMSAINVDWDKPTLKYVKEGNTSYPRVFNLIEIPNEGTWSYWIIQETAGTQVPIPHPIHLHGHDYYVLGSGTGTFDKDSSPQTLTYNNPMRRDTAILPANGWLALAFPTDNPGAWLMHCHIAWHVADGFAVQFLESKSTMPLPGGDWEQTCSNWNSYVPNAVYPKQDSGL